MIELRIPPLRERREEIQPLVEFFLLEVRGGLPPAGGAAAAAACSRRCIGYAWPGNIRELENMMKRFVVLQDESLLLGELVRLQQAAQARRTPAVAAAGAGTGGDGGRAPRPSPAPPPVAADAAAAGRSMPPAPAVPSIPTIRWSTTRASRPTASTCRCWPATRR